MRLYPKVIPAIAREVVQTLSNEGDIEVEPMRVADAEMDMAAIMKEYLANEERVNQATREALERRGYDHSKFNQVKREMADVQAAHGWHAAERTRAMPCPRRAQAALATCRLLRACHSERRRTFFQPVTRASSHISSTETGSTM